jgi:hypothetical protein
MVVQRRMAVEIVVERTEGRLRFDVIGLKIYVGAIVQDFAKAGPKLSICPSSKFACAEECDRRRLSHLRWKMKVRGNMP